MLSGCSESDKEFVFEHDDEVAFHSDFKNQVLVKNWPDFANPLEFPGGYEFSVSEQDICKYNYDVAVTSYKNTPEALGE